MNLYFYASCHGQWIQGNNFTWLFLNTDNNYSTGWIGFDYLVDLCERQLKKYMNSTGNWQYEQSITIMNSGTNQLHFALSYLSLSIWYPTINLEFKWFSADSLYTSDPLNFIDNGDSAPNGRFTYTYMANML
jgi:hypothetical protein